MGNNYDYATIEKKWQLYWKANKTFEVSEDPNIPKDKRRYILDMFPYPSAAGLHVGHPEGYTATDIYSRYLRMQGFHVLHPMGFDSFGLPAENYAIKTGTHPRSTTENNINKFREQIQSLGFSFDWSREVSTHTSNYYKWTQWIFLQLYKKGLAYQSEMPVWFCPALGTVLANEEVLSTPEGPRSERDNHPVERRALRQWMLRITEYAEQLLEGLDHLDWPESIKIMQRNWIGRSEGAEVLFSIESIQETLQVYTTRPDTLWGVTYMVLAPEHPLVHQITTDSQKAKVSKYLKTSSLKSDLERTELAKDKTGIFTGTYATNPVNNKKIPIWISDYVLMNYGTGAIMAVPAHDIRDWEFATKFDLPIKQVVTPHSNTSTVQDIDENSSQQIEVFVSEGITINSAQFSGLPTDEAKTKVTAWLEEQGLGTKQVNYKLRDWIFSRQRYWGEPIPLLRKTDNRGLLDGTIEMIDEKELPLLLPEVACYKPSGTGESPLATIPEWVNVVKGDGSKYLRETNTMPQWAGSCWYYLRYIDPHNEHSFANKDKIEYWMPVDLYLGGAEHAVLHLLYARFWHRVLYDLDYVNTPEPFQRLINQGMILGEDGNKMSKSIGNVINPDEIVNQFGADSLRLYEMFIGPLSQEKPWSTNGLIGVYRFLGRIWKFTEKNFAQEGSSPPIPLLKILHKSIKKITEDCEVLAFNTSIAQLMIVVNEMNNYDVVYKDVWRTFILLLAPFAPHLAEELWELLGNTHTLAYEKWPTYIKELTIDDEIELVLQVNGKVREKLLVPRNLSKEEIEKIALNNKRFQSFIDNRPIKRIIAIPNKLVNVVV